MSTASSDTPSDTSQVVPGQDASTSKDNMGNKSWRMVVGEFDTKPGRPHFSNWAEPKTLVDLTDRIVGDLEYHLHALKNFYRNQAENGRNKVAGMFYDRDWEKALGTEVDMVEKRLTQDLEETALQYGWTPHEISLTQSDSEEKRSYCIAVEIRQGDGETQPQGFISCRLTFDFRKDYESGAGDDGTASFWIISPFCNERLTVSHHSDVDHWHG